MENEAGRQFLEYSRERFTRELERIHLCFDQVAEEEVWWHPGEGCNSVGNLVVHLCGNIGQWMASVARGQTDARDRHREFADRPAMAKAELLARLDDTIEMALRAIQSTDAAKLADPIVIQDYDCSVLTAIYETERHFAEHVGQIAFIAKLKRGKSFKPLWVPQTPAQGA
jgi:uncharacterized damage-inducible protein DinB